MSPSCLKPLSGFTRHLKPELVAAETRVSDPTPADLVHHWSQSCLFPASGPLHRLSCPCHPQSGLAGFLLSHGSKWPCLFLKEGFSDHPIKLDIPVPLSPLPSLQSPDTICNLQFCFSVKSLHRHTGTSPVSHCMSPVPSSVPGILCSLSQANEGTNGWMSTREGLCTQRRWP